MGLFIFWLIMAAIVAIIAGSKGFNWFLWGLYGFVIWPIALVHVLVKRPESPRQPIPVVIAPPEYMPALHHPKYGAPMPQQPALPPHGTMKTCPMCAEQVQAAARICRFCRHEFPEEPAPALPPRPQEGPGYVSTWAPAPARKICAACGEESAAYVDRCPKCSTFFPLARLPGKPPMIPPGMTACPSCGSANDPGVHVCSSCGQRLRVSGA